MAIRRAGGKLYVDVMVLVYNDEDIPWSGQRDPYQLSQWLKQDIEKASRTNPDDPSSNRVVVNIRKTHQIEGIPPRVSPDGDADYNAMIDDALIDGRSVREWIGMADDGDIDEVWLWSSSNGHFEEAIMIGPDPMYTNADRWIVRNDMRNCVFMGFNYQTGDSAEWNMLESFCHRIEGQMMEVYGYSRDWDGEAPPGAPVSDWHKFTANWGNTYNWDGVRAGADQDHPAGAGWSHFAPSSDEDYDVDNPRRVWVRTPAFRDPNLPLDDPAFREEINDPNGTDCALNDWNTGRFPGRSDPQEYDGDPARHYHHRANFLVWWMYHLPKFDGTYQAVLNGGASATRLKNWWEYIFGYNAPYGDAYRVLTSGTAMAPAALGDGYIYGADPNSFIEAFFTSDDGDDGGSLLKMRTRTLAGQDKEIDRAFLAFSNTPSIYPARESGQVLVARAVRLHCYVNNVYLYNYPYSPAKMSFWDHEWREPLLTNREANWDELGPMRSSWQLLGDYDIGDQGVWYTIPLRGGGWAHPSRSIIKCGGKLQQTDQPTEWSEQFDAYVYIASGNSPEQAPYLEIDWELREYWAGRQRSGGFPQIWPQGGWTSGASNVYWYGPSRGVRFEPNATEHWADFYFRVPNDWDGSDITLYAQVFNSTPNAGEKWTIFWEYTVDQAGQWGETRSGTTHLEMIWGYNQADAPNRVTLLTIPRGELASGRLVRARIRSAYTMTYGKVLESVWIRWRLNHAQIWPQDGWTSGGGNVFWNGPSRGVRFGAQATAKWADFYFKLPVGQTALPIRAQVFNQAANADEGWVIAWEYNVDAAGSWGPLRSGTTNLGTVHGYNRPGAPDHVVLLTVPAGDVVMGRTLRVRIRNNAAMTYDKNLEAVWLDYASPYASMVALQLWPENGWTTGDSNVYWYSPSRGVVFGKLGTTRWLDVYFRAPTVWSLGLDLRLRAQVFNGAANASEPWTIAWEYNVDEAGSWGPLRSGTRSLGTIYGYNQPGAPNHVDLLTIPAADWSPGKLIRVRIRNSQAMTYNKVLELVWME